MSNSQPPPGESTAGTAARLLATLPAPYLALVLVNILIIGGLIYLEDRAANHRSALIANLLDTCIGRAAQLTDISKSITEQRVRFQDLDQRERAVELQLAGLQARFDAIDQASNAALHQPKRTR